MGALRYALYFLYFIRLALWIVNYRFIFSSDSRTHNAETSEKALLVTAINPSNQLVKRVNKEQQDVCNAYIQPSPCNNKCHVNRTTASSDTKSLPTIALVMQRVYTSFPHTSRSILERPSIAGSLLGCRIGVIHCCCSEACQSEQCSRIVPHISTNKTQGISFLRNTQLPCTLGMNETKTIRPSQYPVITV